MPKSGMLVMTLLVKNERDIIDANLAFHLNSGVDHIIVTDNNSDDGTRDLLAAWARNREITVIDELGDNFAQHKWVTRMALIAAEQYKAHWIINNDADEFWTHTSGNLRSALSSVDSHIALCERQNMVYAYDDRSEVVWCQRLIYRAHNPAAPTPRSLPTDPVDGPHFMKQLPPKAILRSEGLVAVAQGNHTATYDREVSSNGCDILIYHYPIRSTAQFEAKISQGGAAYARNTDLPLDQGWHWRRWHRLIQDKGVYAALAEALPSRAMIETGLSDGSVARDTVMAAPLQRLLRPHHGVADARRINSA